VYHGEAAKNPLRHPSDVSEADDYIREVRISTAPQLSISRVVK